jgi:biotin carboxylase
LVLLVPTGTYRAGDFVAAAGRLGAEVVVASERRQALAASMGDRALVVPMSDPARAAERIVELARRSPVDGVVAVDDQGVVAAALAASRLGLPHADPEAVARTRDKAAMRARLGETGVPQPAWRLAGPGEDVGALAEEVGLPCVVKPLGLSASRGVIRADSVPEARTAAKRARQIAAQSEAGLGTAAGGAALLVERFLPGAEVAVEGLLRAGHLQVLAVFDKPDPLEGPYFEETLYVTPSRLSGDLLAEVAGVTSRACAALGLTEGPVHAELRISPGLAREAVAPAEGASGPSVSVIELAARSIGGLCSRALVFGTGVSLEELIVAHALGHPLDQVRREESAAGVMMLPIPRAGTLAGVSGRDRALAVPGIRGLEISIPTGRPVVPLPEGDRYLGFLFAGGEAPEEVEAALRRAHAALDIRIDT